MPPLRIAVAQINATVGDLPGNAAKIAAYAARAAGWGADVVVFPELALAGYPPEDLVFRPAFVEANRRWLEWLAAETAGGPVLVVGFVDGEREPYNAAAVIGGGRVRAAARKRFLPNYSVFDEQRHFRPGTEALVIRLAGVALGVTICEDIWVPEGPGREQALFGGAEVILNLSASPFQAGKAGERESMLRSRAADYGVAIAYANLVGGQDELVFDGRSLVVTAGGEVVARGRPFEEDLILWDFDPRESFSRRMQDARWRHVPPGAGEGTRVRVVDLGEPAGEPAPGSHGKPSLPARDGVADLAGEAEVYAALVLAVRDYVRKNGFSGAVLGLSGGIDSALVAAIAADALGPERVVGVRMPSPFTSEASLRDAAEVAANLGIRLETIPIADIFASYRQALAPLFGDRPFDVAEENLQARIRGTLLMALSNKFGWLVLATGNKSELGAGYTTLYGDMAGGFSPLKDVPKTLVYRLVEYRNRRDGRPVIPRSVLEKPPSAELRPGQKDEDSLPPYTVLDPILELYVERDLPVDLIVARGFPEETVRRVARLVRSSEYKRRQAAPGPKITARALGRDRRYPITNRFEEP
ncbi:MAG: NAD+ synthase [Bacillota bacterium]|nr:MAG: NAD+ synthase [Bacillota bacterium]